MLKNLKLSVKITAGYAVIILVLLVVGFLSINKMGALTTLTEKLYLHPLAVSNAALSVEANMLVMQSGMKNVALAVNLKEIDAAVSSINFHEKRCLRSLT